MDGHNLTSQNARESTIGNLGEVSPMLIFAFLGQSPKAQSILPLEQLGVLQRTLGSYRSVYLERCTEAHIRGIAVAPAGDGRPG